MPREVLKEQLFRFPERPWSAWFQDTKWWFEAFFVYTLWKGIAAEVEKEKIGYGRVRRKLVRIAKQDL